MSDSDASPPLVTERKSVAAIPRRSARHGSLTQPKIKWRPRLSLGSLFLATLFGGSLFLIYLHWQPWVRILTLPGHPNGVNSLCFSSDGLRLVSGGEDKFARVWDLTTGKQSAEIQHAAAVSAAALSPDMQTVVTTALGQPALAFNANTGEFSHNYALPLAWGTRTFPVGATFSPDGALLLTHEANGAATIYAADGTYKLRLDSIGPLASVSFSSEGNRVIMASDAGQVTVFESDSGKPIMALSGTGQKFRSASVSPDGRRIVASSLDSSATLWRVSDGEEDERTLLEKQNNNTRAMRKTTQWYARKIATLRGHTQFVLSAQFSPDGERVVTASLDGTFHVWDSSTGEDLSVIDSGKPLRIAVFAPNAARIACAGHDGSIEIWQRRRREGLAALADFPAVWLAFILAPLFFGSVIRDQTTLRRVAIRAAAQTAETDAKLPPE